MGEVHALDTIHNLVSGVNLSVFLRFGRPVADSDLTDGLVSTRGTSSADVDIVRSRELTST